MTWVIQSQATDIDSLQTEESLFFNGNGYLGVRGNFEEGMKNRSLTIRGTYINGFHDYVDIPYGEKHFGFPDTQQKLLNIIDAQTIEVWIGEKDKKEMVSLWTGEVLAYVRKLHVREGISERMIHWRSSHGHELKMHIKRLVSFTTKELFIQQMTLTPISTNIPVMIRSVINGDVENFTDNVDPRVASGHGKHLHVVNTDKITNGDFIEVEAENSKLRAGALSSITVSEENTIYMRNVQESFIETTAQFTLETETTVEKRTLFTDSIRHQDIQGHLLLLKQEIDPITFSHFRLQQRNYLATFWENTAVIIQGEEKLQEGIRFNLFHILQSAGQDGMTSISAKGLSGEGYEGHYFWDTEIYLIPLFTLTNPALAKQLLLFRYSILGDARTWAKTMGHGQGALFPWRTINGTECSSYYPSGSAQYHLSADIAYSYIQYYLATNDQQFLQDAGAEVLIETARLWIDTGHFSDNHFKIDAVTGPDEYTCIVNNNYYTNTMAKHNLLWAYKVAELLQTEAAEHWNVLKEKLSLRDEELSLFKQAAEKMYLPVHESLHINPQDDTFLQKEKWDFKETPSNHYPLLLYYHPLTIYRYQVCKQPDTVLAHFLLEDEQSEEVMKNSYDYYETITTHDSSLSSCVFSMMGARHGYLDKAYDYFNETARLDLDNLQGNTKDGLHMANMGGTWLAIVAGFAGTRVKENGLHFRPQLPSQWKGYSFRLQFHGQSLQLSISKERFIVQLVTGEGLSVYIWNRRLQLTKEHPINLSIDFLQGFKGEK